MTTSAKLQGMVVLVPVYNAWDYARTCLESLAPYYEKGIRVLVVDDYSDEETRKALAEHRDQVGASYGERMEVLWRTGRGWFTRAVNTGLHYLLEGMTSEWVLVLNSDCVVGAGALEELLDVWDEVGATGKRVGMVGSEGPRQPPDPRWVLREEKAGHGYVTGHALLLSVPMLRAEKLRFPQDNGEVAGFSAMELMHINSDRALCWEMNRRGYATVASYYSAIGHHGGKSWGHDLSAMQRAAKDVIRRGK